MFADGWKTIKVLALALALGLMVGGCALPVFSPDPVQAKVTAVTLKVLMAAGGAALQVVADETGLRIDAKDLLAQIVGSEEAQRNLPPSDVPVVMVVDKSTNDVLYWQLTESVRTVRLRHADPGAIELKVANETPLRVELWVEEGVEDFQIEVEFRE